MQKLCKYRFYWYELDPALKVGEVTALSCIRDSNPLEIHSGFISGTPIVNVNCKILSIYHPELGYLEDIDTTGLEYCLTLTDGRKLKVEAEEEPGKVYSFPIQPKAWDFQVLIEKIEK